MKVLGEASMNINDFSHKNVVHFVRSLSDLDDGAKKFFVERTECQFYVKYLTDRFMLHIDSNGTESFYTIIKRVSDSEFIELRIGLDTSNASFMNSAFEATTSISRNEKFLMKTNDFWLNSVFSNFLELSVISQP
jgi:hypothetical protein